jgi:hypothetical protein
MDIISEEISSKENELWGVDDEWLNCDNIVDSRRKRANFKPRSITSWDAKVGKGAVFLDVLSEDSQTAESTEHVHRVHRYR